MPGGYPAALNRVGVATLLMSVLVAICFLLWAAPSPAAAAASPDVATSTGRPDRVTIAVVPGGITVRDLDRIRPAAIGLMNPGLGDVPPAQTWLDLGQGARVFDNKYAEPLGYLLPGRDRIFGWTGVVRRADTTDVPIRPGLLASTLLRHGLPVGTDAGTGLPAIIAARRSGRFVRSGGACPGAACRLALTVADVTLDQAVRLARERQGRELLIVIEAPPARSGEQLAVAVAGPGFRGMLRSPGTRTDGYLLSTDIGPTVLAHFEVHVPGAMTGLPLETGGRIDYDRLEQLEGRYQQVGKRRGAALAVPLLLWVALAAAAALVTRGWLARPALRLLCLAVILLPAVLLLTAAISPSLAAERAIATLLPVAIAIGLLRLLPGYGALAGACALTVIPFGVDMLAGSVLTPSAVIGPNPGLGARFYGIGNELESTLMILTSVGTGAALTAPASRRPARAANPDRDSACDSGPDPDVGAGSRRWAAWSFALVGLVATVTFAAGRFGADAGAAIVFPVAGVVAVALVLKRPRLAWLGALAAGAALVLIGLADVITGGETHFTRSVLGGSDESFFGQVLLHRLDATVESFTRTSRIPVTVVALLLIGLAIRSRGTIRAWLRPVPMLAAGVVAAAVGSVVGALTNDSGVLFLQVGVLYLGLVLGFIWTGQPARTESDEPDRSRVKLT